MTKPRVLVIDDEEKVAHIFAGFLRSIGGFEVSTAIGGADGISCALSQRPDLILSDVSMPDVDGVQLVNKLKDARLKTRVIFITAYRTALAETVNFVKLGSVMCFTSPLRLRRWVNAVKRALALESPLSLYASEPSSIIKEAVLENDSLRSQLQELRHSSRRHLVLEVAVRLLYLAAATACPEHTSTQVPSSAAIST